MKKFILFPVFTFLCLFTFGQNAKIDSLLNALKVAKEDTIKIKSLNALSEQFWRVGIYNSALIYAQKAKEFSEKLNFKKGEASAHNNIGIVYYFKGNYYLALDEYFDALKIQEEIGDKKGISISHNNIGAIYEMQGDYPKALKEYFASLKEKEEMEDKKGVGNSHNNIGNIYRNQGNNTAALNQYFASLKIQEENENKEGIAASHGNIGNIYESQGDYFQALKEHLKALRIYQEIGDKKGIADSHINISNVYSRKRDYLEALNENSEALGVYQEIGNQEGVIYCYNNLGVLNIKLRNYSSSRKNLEKALLVAKEIGNNNAIKDNYYAFTMLDSALGNWKETFEHHKLYIQYRDNLLNAENTKKTVQTQMQYDFDKKEAATKAETEKKDVLAKAEINKQKIIRNSIAGGTSIVALSSIFSFMVYKRKREASFKNKVAEVEMKALRSQMNPHFIFNSLNSIKRYMANHDNKTAEDYLTKFASVMRMILENSEHKEVPLQQDLKALELYMQLESLRMKKKFNYEIKVDESIDAENTLIPPLILQPFVENSIWHGLAGKDGEGKISIHINKVGEMIECTVEDNGVGRKKSEEAKGGYALPGKKSLGMKITNARIDILNKIKKSKAGVELVDLAEGMKVIVRLPLELSF